MGVMCLSVFRGRACVSYFKKRSLSFFIAFTLCFPLVMLEVHAGKTKFRIKDHACMRSTLLPDPSLSLSSVCLSLPEWIHPTAHRCSLWQRERGHAPAEPRGSRGLHSQGRTHGLRLSGPVWTHCCSIHSAYLLFIVSEPFIEIRGTYIDKLYCKWHFRTVCS